MLQKRLHGALCAALLLATPVMAAEQSSYVAPTSGPMSMSTFAGTYLNPGLRALASCSWGSSAPANGPSGAPLPYQCWADTTSAPVLFKYYDGASWVTYGALDTSTHAWTPYLTGGTSGGVPYFSSAGVMGSSAALAQHGFLVGGGAGAAPSSIAACTDDQIAFGRTSNSPLCRTVTGDITFSTGAASIGAGKVTNDMLAGSIAASKLIGTDIATVGTITAGTWNGATIAVANGGTGATSESAARSSLGLAIGSDVQAWDADLDAFALKTAPTGDVVGTSDAQTLTNKTLTSPAITTPTGIVKGDVGLGNVDNTSDATKWAAAATLTNKTFDTGGTGNSFSINGVAATANTGTGAVVRADSPALTGAPTAPTASPSDNSTKIATTAYVDAQVAGGVAGVASLNGQTGTLTSYYAPQGRLTLQSSTPVMTTTQSAKTTLYYTPYVGNQIPIYDGSNMVPTTFAELSVATTDTTKNPSAIGAGKVNDWFVWNDGGTLRLSHGPDWTDDTTRSAGTALTISAGFLSNAVDITNGPLADRGTYVGTTRSNASSQLDWIFGASGTAPFFGVWNMYNRVVVSTTWFDGQSSWSYNSTTVRPLNNRAIARVSFVRGLNDDGVQMLVQTYTDTNSGTVANFGIGVDSSTVNFVQMQATSPSVAGIGSVQYAGTPGEGFRYLQQTERLGGSGSYTAYGTSSLSNLTFSGRM